MRAILYCILFAVASSWAFFGGWTSLQFYKGYLDIDTTKTCNVDTTYINCSLYDGLVYYSTLDTDYIVVAKPRLATLQVYANAPIDSNSFTYQFAHSIQEVIRYEFMNWLEWCIIKMTKDSAQRLLDCILPESRDIQGRTIIHKKVCDEESPLSCQGEALWGGSGSPGLTEEDAARLPQKKILAESAISVPADTSAKIPVDEQPGDTTSAAEDSLGNPLRFTKAVPLAGSVTQGMQYRVFDMNGVYLYEDRWQGSIKALGRPVIVRFGNGLTKVFR